MCGIVGESERLIDRLGEDLVYGTSSLGEFAGMKKVDFYIRVYQIVQAIPRGQVATYGQIAWILGKPQCSRRVGQALYHAPHDVNLPCHRVVNSKGGLVQHWAEQKDLLLREGVAFKNTVVWI
jgi:methylated-DNA-protein-cysteine methyltransferase-like protein